LEWTEAGVEGAFRFVQRIWRLVGEPLDGLPPAPLNGAPPDLTKSAIELRRTSHKTVAAVTEDIERFRFNRAVARIHELVNAVSGFEAQDSGGRWALRETLETLVRLIGPMMPHLAEELWRTLGHETLLAAEDWPEADAELLVDDTVTVAVQVNGKLRATIELPLDAEDQAAQNQALAEPAVRRAMGERAARKIIVVRNRVVNVVV
jgi:leucyl-tRNA synthetase